MNWLVIGISFYADFQSRTLKHFCNPLELGRSPREQFSLAAIEETELLQADDETFGCDAQNHLVIRQLFADGGLQLATQLLHVGHRSYRRFLDTALVVLQSRGTVGGLPDGLGIGAAISVFIRLESAQRLKAIVNGAGELLDRLIVAIRAGKEHDKEGEKESYKIGIGYQPTVVVDGLFSLLFSSHHDATFAKPGLGAELR